MLVTRRTSNAGLGIIGAILLALGAVIVVGIVFSALGGKVESTSRSSEPNIQYRLNGSGDASVTMSNANGDTEQRTKVSLPWQTAPFSAKRGAFLYVSGQAGRDTAHITCEIVIDGAVVRTSTSTGPHSIASCSGRY